MATMMTLMHPKYYKELFNHRKERLRKFDENSIEFIICLCYWAVNIMSEGADFFLLHLISTLL